MKGTAEFTVIGADAPQCRSKAEELACQVARVDSLHELVTYTLRGGTLEVEESKRTLAGQAISATWFQPFVFTWETQPEEDTP